MKKITILGTMIVNQNMKRKKKFMIIVDIMKIIVMITMDTTMIVDTLMIMAITMITDTIS